MMGTIRKIGVGLGYPLLGLVGWLVARSTILASPAFLITMLPGVWFYKNNKVSVQERDTIPMITIGVLSLFTLALAFLGIGADLIFVF